MTVFLGTRKRYKKGVKRISGKGKAWSIYWLLEAFVRKINSGLGQTYFCVQHVGNTSQDNIVYSLSLYHFLPSLSFLTLSPCLSISMYLPLCVPFTLSILCTHASAFLRRLLIIPYRSFTIALWLSHSTWFSFWIYSVTLTSSFYTLISLRSFAFNFIIFPY